MKDDLIKALEELKEVANVDERVGKLVSLVNLKGSSGSIEMILDSVATVSMVCSSIAKEALQNNLVSISILIDGIKDFNADYYQVDGYANYNSWTSEAVDDLIDEILDNERRG